MVVPLGRVRLAPDTERIYKPPAAFLLVWPARARASTPEGLWLAAYGPESGSAPRD
ncbi:MAG: hypothetical protein WCG66_12795 [bacterium]